MKSFVWHKLLAVTAFVPLLLAISCSQTDTSITSSHGTVSGRTADTPTILSFDPPDGAMGVLNDTNLVITFSEPMDTTSVEAAYWAEDQGLQANQVKFFWNADQSVLTIDPQINLVYNTGSNPNEVIPKLYKYGFSDLGQSQSATSLASIDASLYTARLIKATILSTPALDGSASSDGFSENTTPFLSVGDNATNLGIRGYLSFDLSSIPQSVSSAGIYSATLIATKTNEVGKPYVNLKTPCPVFRCPTLPSSVQVNHVNYGNTLDGTDYNTPNLGVLGDLDRPACRSVGFRYGCDTTTPNGLKSINVRDAVQDDWNKRDTRGKRSQYQLSFQRETNGDNKFDLVVFTPGEASSNQPMLEVQYAMP